MQLSPTVLASVVVFRRRVGGGGGGDGVVYITRGTQRAQTSLAKADHYAHINHCKNVEPWW